MMSTVLAVASLPTTSRYKLSKDVQTAAINRRFHLATTMTLISDSNKSEKRIWVDKFLDRVPSKGYTCLHFVRDVWAETFSEDVTIRIQTFIEDFVKRGEKLRGVRNFERLLVPESPCFVVMQRLKCTPHIGIFYQGRILHLAYHGAEYRPLDVARGYFQTIRFYK